MSSLPKIKIKVPSADPGEYTCELEQAKDYLDFDNGVFVIEGQGIHSFDELVRIASQEKYRNTEFLIVELLQPLTGG